MTKNNRTETLKAGFKSNEKDLRERVCMWKSKGGGGGFPVSRGVLVSCIICGHLSVIFVYVITQAFSIRTILVAVDADDSGIFNVLSTGNHN